MNTSQHKVNANIKDSQYIIDNKLVEYKKALYNSLLPDKLRGSKKVSDQINDLLSIRVDNILGHYNYFRETRPIKIGFECCLDVFENFNIQNLKKFNNEITNLIIPLLTAYIHKSIASSLKKHYSSNSNLDRLLADLLFNIQRNQYYTTTKKYKHYISGKNHLTKRINDFIDSDDLLKYHISLYLKKIEKANNHINGVSEVLVALIPFLIDYYLNNAVDILFEFLFKDRENNLINEYNSKILSADANMKNISIEEMIISDEQAFELQEDISASTVLDDEQVQFINEIGSLCKEYDLSLPYGDVENYLSRMIKKDNPIRLFEWLKIKNISYSELFQNNIYDIIGKYGYDECSNFEESDKEIYANTTTDEKYVIIEQNILENDENIIRLDTIDEVTRYIEQKFPFIDMKTFLDDYDSLTTLHQEKFIDQINKSLLNHKLWTRQYNYKRRSYYRKLPFMQEFRFAIEDSGRTFLGSHKNYDNRLDIR